MKAILISTVILWHYSNRAIVWGRRGFVIVMVNFLHLTKNSKCNNYFSCWPCTQFKAEHKIFCCWNCFVCTSDTHSSLDCKQLNIGQYTRHYPAACELSWIINRSYNLVNRGKQRKWLGLSFDQLTVKWLLTTRAVQTVRSAGEISEDNKDKKTLGSGNNIQ